VKEIMLHLARCNGCLSCAVACAIEHSESKTLLGAVLENSKPRLSVEPFLDRAAPVMCRHCTEPACVDACMAGAMQRDEATGLVTNEGPGQQCVGCWMCVMACPYGAIIQETVPEKKALKCDRCPGREIPACVQACPNAALVFEEPGRFAAEIRRGSLVGLTASGPTEQGRG
jgi:carbon-monoxide dehydrogenase iron sulfur subunit